MAGMQEDGNMAAGPDEPLEMAEPVENPDYQAFLDDYNSHFAPAPGELLHGHVLSVSDKEVIVDIGRKTEGLVPASQFPFENGQPAVKRGDVIEVMFDRTGEPVEGYILLSYERAHRQHVWEQLEQAAASGAPVSGRVTAKVKGGLAVDIGVNAFLPSSQVETRPIHNLDLYVGQTVDVRILKLNRRRSNAVVSRRALIEDDLQARKAQALAAIHEGAEVRGVVKNLTDYGAFVDLGGIDGLLHVSDLSYGNVSHPSAMIAVGQELRLKVLKFDREHERISLGLKQLQPDPWLDVQTRYAVGSRVIGRVVSVTDYGAFIELEPGVEGLIHISEMTWSRRMKHPSKIVSIGDQVEAVVLDVKPGERRISLGIKQLEADPWTTIADRYSVGSVVEGRVRKLADFGAFVEIEDGIDGLVHISDMSWTAHLKHPSEMLKKGQLVQAVVLQIDAPNRRLSLGIKQLQPDNWETFFRSHQVGDIVHGRVCRVAPFGVFVEVLPGVEALCHKSEIAGATSKQGDKQRGKDEFLPVGAEFDFKVIKLNEAQKRIGLSLHDVHEDAERSRIDEYRRQAAIATSTVGDAMRQNRTNYRDRNYDEG
jgi:small subunit ribosomal protein S1